MISREAVTPRPNWQTRVSKKGLSPHSWTEGSMVVLGNPADLVDALVSYAATVPDRLNDLFREGDPLSMPTFGTLRPEQVFNAVASSWAHQDPSFPLRFDIAVKKNGGFALLAVKGDYLEGMVAAASVCKAWHLHHFEGMSNILEVNFLTEHLTRELQPFGNHASPPAIQDVTVLSSESLCAGYIASCIGEGSGLRLSSVGIGTLEDIDKVEGDSESQRTKSVIKVDPWSKILKNVDAESAWFNLFDTPRSFTFQPAWVLALDEMIDFAEDVEEDQVELVLNIWLNVNTQGPVPLVVSSEYKTGYKFENSIITPVVLEVKDSDSVE